MKTAQRLLQWYEEGRLTSHGLILTVLSLSDRQVVAEVLEAVPPDLGKQLREFAKRYRSGARVFNGPRPEMATVRFVRERFSRVHTA